MSDFFVLTDKPGSHHALPFWLKKRKFNHFDTDRTDKHGNKLICLFNKEETGVTKCGIICCIGPAIDQVAEQLVLNHLQEYDHE